MATRSESIKFLANQLSRLSELTGRSLHISRWSPGDGWTRYSIVDTTDGGEAYFAYPHMMRKSELETAIAYAIAGAYVAKNGTPR